MGLGKEFRDASANPESSCTACCTASTACNSFATVKWGGSCIQRAQKAYKARDFCRSHFDPLLFGSKSVMPSPRQLSEISPIASARYHRSPVVRIPRGGLV